MDDYLIICFHDTLLFKYYTIFSLKIKNALLHNPYNCYNRLI